MSGAINFLNIILPILYAATFGVYLIDFFKDYKSLNDSKRIFLFVTLVLHTGYLLARTVEFNHTPITTKFEIFTVLSFSLAFSYFLLELLTDVRKTGAFILVFALIFQVISSMFIEDLVQVPAILRDRALGLHVISALLGYSGITISAVYGFLFYALYNEIKLSRFGLIFERLPSLETLEKLSYSAVVIGFSMLTISIAIGIVWLPDAFPNFSYTDPKLISTALVWLVYGVGILAKVVANWYGKKVIAFSVTGFVIAMFSLLLSNIVASSFHSFY